MSRATKIFIGALTVGLISLIATSAETVTYSYDARGRLIKVVHTGTVNNNNQVCYKLDKAEYDSGKGEKGNADTFGEKGLGFVVKAIAEKAGDYTINGVFKFGVCDAQSCHPKRQPIAIFVHAK